MNNLFKKGFASLALVSAMTSSIFGGNAAYIDVKVNYLSGGNEAVLGGDDNKSERVELLIAVLDEDGNYATHDKSGLVSIYDADMRVVRGVSSTDVIPQIVALGGDYNNTQTINRGLAENKNINRLVLDYTDGAFTNLTDSLIIKASAITRTFTVNLKSVKAKGLIVRATTKGELLDSTDTKNVINARFNVIKVIGDGALNDISDRAPGGLAGISIPLKIYASTQESNETNGTVSSGRFTYAPNLQAKTIMVQAVADYDRDGAADIFIGEPIKLTMMNGLAEGKIEITKAISTAPFGGFATELATNGLGVSFIAYAEGDTDISNTNVVDADHDNILDNPISGEDNDSNGVVIVPLPAMALKVGQFSTATGKFTKTSTNIYVSDVNGSTEFNSSNDGAGASAGTGGDGNTSAIVFISPVDKYENPAIIKNSGTGGVNARSIRFGGAATNAEDPDRSFYFNATSSTISVTTATVLSVGIVDIYDEMDRNGTKTQSLTVDYSQDELSAVAPVVLTVNGIAPISSKISGASLLKDEIASAVATDNLLLSKVGDDNTTALRVILKGNPSTGNNKLVVQIPDTERAGDFVNESAYELFLGGNKIDYVSDSNGWDINMSGIPAAEANRTLIFVAQAPDENISTIIFDRNWSEDTVANKIDTASITIDFKPLNTRKMPAYFSATYSNDRGDEEVNVGDVVSFEFSGSAVHVGDSVRIDFDGGILNEHNVSGNTSDITVALFGDNKKQSDNAANRQFVVTTIPENKIVKVQLLEIRDRNNSDDQPLLTTTLKSDDDRGISYYSITGVKINNDMTVSNLNAKDDKRDTRGIIEMSDTAVVEVQALEITKAATLKISNVPATTAHTGSNGSGDDERNIKLMSANANQVKTHAVTGAITISKELLTGTYYRLLENDENLTLTGPYGNRIALRDTSMDRVYTLSATEGTTVSMNRGGDSTSPAYVIFKAEAAGTTQVVTIKTSDGNASQTITFTKIAGSTQNTKISITKDSGNEKFDVANSEIVIKVVGDGGRVAGDTNVEFVHSNGGKIRVVPVLASLGKEYSDILEDGSAKLQYIAAKGTYYIVSTDKSGTITVNAKSKILRADSDTNKDEDIAGSATFEFKVIDLNNPLVAKSDVTSGPGFISVKINEANLDLAKTTVKIYTINDAFVKDATYADGIYTAKGLASGTYIVHIDAYDDASNHASFEIARATEAGKSLEDLLVGNGSYVIDGKFASHDFKDVDSSFDWVYARGDKVYQLNAKDSKDKSPFKWGEATDVTVGDTNAWSMIKLTGTEGSADEAGAFGWVLVNAAGDTFKLLGANDDGTFKFSKALYVKGTMSGSNISFAKR